MIGLLCFVAAVLASAFKSNIRLEAENAMLRYQLVVLRRKLKDRCLGKRPLGYESSYFTKIMSAGMITQRSCAYLGAI